MTSILNLIGFKLSYIHFLISLYHIMYFVKVHETYFYFSQVSVRCRGDLIDGCPIRIMVMADQSSFPENVRVGKITTAVVGEELQFQGEIN